MTVNLGTPMTRRSLLSLKYCLALLGVSIGGLLVTSNTFLPCGNEGNPNPSRLSKAFQGPLEADDPTVIQLLRSRYIERPSSKPYNFSQDPGYIRTKNIYTWPMLHKNIRRLFENQTEGIFIEAGALDGEYLSNSLWLEKERNWTGLLIEPDPYNYKELLLKNRRAWTSNTCISSEPYPKHTIILSRRKEKKSQLLNYPWVFRGSSHELGYTMPPRYDSLLSDTSVTYVKVQCFPLYSYLLYLNVTTIDLISLDLQGSEMDVIKSFPLDKIKVRALIVEYTQTTPNNTETAFIQYFHDRGYVLLDCLTDLDYVFILHDEFKINSFEIKEKC